MNLRGAVGIQREHCSPVMFDWMERQREMYSGMFEAFKLGQQRIILLNSIIFLWGPTEVRANEGGTANCIGPYSDAIRPTEVRANKAGNTKFDGGNLE